VRGGEVFPCRVNGFQHPEHIRFKLTPVIVNGELFKASPDTETRIGNNIVNTAKLIYCLFCGRLKIIVTAYVAGDRKRLPSH
jgi:hypothetical protein